jgi:hypothetical protein
MDEAAMNIKQLSDIHNFYTHFLAKITLIQTSRRALSDNEHDKKSELAEWLNQHKADKTFGENVRHEIFHMLELIEETPVSLLESKVATLERNCEIICNKMKEENFINRISIRSQTRPNVTLQL